jgi:predicted DNA-binding transcriptional regulator AlpA
MSITNEQLLRLPDVLRLFPVCRSSWYNGIKAGKYPPPIKISIRTSAWRRSDILALIEQTATAQGGKS